MTTKSVLIQLSGNDLEMLIFDCVDRAIKLNQSINTPTTATDEDIPLNVQQAAVLLRIAPQTVYQRIKDLPHKKRFGKLYFLKSELIAYLEAGSQKGRRQ